MFRRLCIAGATVLLVTLCLHRSPVTQAEDTGITDCCTLVGDYDGNGLIDYWDYTNVLHAGVLGNFHPDTAVICQEHRDANGDCEVDGFSQVTQDYIILNRYLYRLMDSILVLETCSSMVVECSGQGGR